MSKAKIEAKQSNMGSGLKIIQHSEDDRKKIFTASDGEGVIIEITGDGNLLQTLFDILGNFTREVDDILVEGKATW